MHPSPNIWRSSVIEKKKTEILRVNRGFRKEKSDIMCYILEMKYTLSCQPAETEEKSEKRSSEIFGVKWNFFPKERSFENLFREKFFSVPPNSAPCLRV